MTTLADHLYVPGPLHPDMFDGETPILVPLKNPPRAYEVRVSYRVIEHDSRAVRVAARNKTEAMQAEVELLERNACNNEDNFEAQSASPLERAPTDSELTAWQARQEGAKA